MQRRISIPTLLVALVLVAGCGGTPSGSTAKPGATSGPASTGKAPGQVDCAAIKTAAEQLIGIQLMAQFRTPETVESIRDQQIGSLDLDAMLAAFEVLHTLDGYRSVLGDPKAAIDFYEKAATAAKELFATDPITQAAIDAFNAENVPDVATFLSHQVGIAGAIDEADC